MTSPTCNRNCLVITLRNATKSMKIKNKIHFDYESSAEKLLMTRSSIHGKKIRLNHEIIWLASESNFLRYAAIISCPIFVSHLIQLTHFNP